MNHEQTSQKGTWCAPKFLTAPCIGRKVAWTQDWRPTGAAQPASDTSTHQTTPRRCHPDRALCPTAQHKALCRKIKLSTQRSFIYMRLIFFRNYSGIPTGRVKKGMRRHPLETI